MRKIPFVLLLSLFTADLPAKDSVPVDFSRQILPILSNKCFVCHGPDTSDPDQLRLDRFETATADRGGYRAINQQEPRKSELLLRVLSSDDPMPPTDAEKQLSVVERDLLVRWIQQGGRYGTHWSFIPPRRTELPGVASGHLDAFIEQGLRKAGIGFADQADRETLARRAALVLTGLPPELDLLSEFMQDRTSGAYERFIDRLLADPRYGEHQARYWLDAVRYGDTHGLHLDNRRGIYPYRDWVVKAMNDNLPLDRFIEWQLAGDLLPNPTLSQRVATGFVRMNPSTAEGGAIPAEFQAKNNFDRTETLGTVLLGMSLTCARCHSHKYDPITQTEYYQLLAFFNSTAEPAMDGNKYEYGPTLKVPSDQTGWKAWSELESERRSLLNQVNPKVVAGDVGLEFAKTWMTRVEDVNRMQQLAESPAICEKLGVKSSVDALTLKIKEIESEFTTTLVAAELDQPRNTHVLRRGEYNLPTGDPVVPGVFAVMGSMPDELPKNRLGLARWLTSREHPLVSRVLVNRIWQRVFGAGLVRTPEDFGLQGQQPTHPMLLDWLAVELQESGWDLKKMLKLMLTSRTFLQVSTYRTDVDDPENRLFARGPGYRLDAEILRDIGLWASGLLDPHMGGEGIKPYQPAGMWLAMAHPASNTKKYEQDQGVRLYRRSLYVYWKRTSPHPMMTLFDAPTREASCVRRSRTNTALQSLGLLNEMQRVEMARKLAERLLTSEQNEQARLSLLFRLLASRKPDPTEQKICLELLARTKQRYASAEPDATALVSIGNAKRDESLDATDVAAWTQVCNTVLASDLAILLY